MNQIITSRLILKPWRKKDAADLYEYARNPNVGPRSGWKPHESVKESRKIIKTFFLPSGTWAIRDKETGKVIGSIGLDEDRFRPFIKSRELGYSLAEEYWGRGLMTEAAKAIIRYGFEVMKLDIISICTGPENKRSQSVIKKCGFTYEGTLRQAYKIYDGSVRDVLCHSLLREDYMREAEGEN